MPWSLRQSQLTYNQPRNIFSLQKRGLPRLRRERRGKPRLYRKFRLRIRGYVVLHLQFVEHIEIGVQIVVLLQCLKIADSGSRLDRQTERWRIGRDGSGLDKVRLIGNTDDERTGKHYGRQRHGPRRTP